MFFPYSSPGLKQADQDRPFFLSQKVFRLCHLTFDSCSRIITELRQKGMHKLTLGRLKVVVRLPQNDTRAIREWGRWWPERQGEK